MEQGIITTPVGETVSTESETIHAIRKDEGGNIIYIEDDIMEHHLGRKLASNERVRHRDGMGLNNQFANLELVIVGEGQPEGRAS